MSPASADETELEMVRRHVREGAGHVTKQRARIARMKAACLPIKEAEVLLRAFEDTQKQHEAHLARLEDAAVVKPGSARG